MSGTPPTIEWYIARDGVQHGPISDVEMRKFVELGHLRSTDLVWCARFAAWQSGGQVFPETLAPKPAPPSSHPSPSQPQSRPAAPQSKPQPASPPASAQQPASSPAAHNPMSASLERPVQPQRPAGPAATAAAARSLPRQDSDTAWAEAMRTAVDGAPRGHAAARAAPSAAFASGHQATPDTFTQPLAAPHAMHAAPAPGTSLSPAGDTSMTAGPAPFAVAPGAVRMQPAPPEPEPLSDDEPPYRPRRSRIGMATAVLAVLLIIGGLGWFLWQNRTLVSGAGATAVGAMMQTARPSVPSADHFRAPPYQAPGETREQIDAALQRIAVWRYLKREFGEWYNEIVGEVERRRAQKVDERQITQFLVDVIVTLRRRHAATALQASSGHLKAMAGAFVTNLKQLGSRDGATCFAFVSHGESSPFMVELSRTPAFAETLQKQMISVFEAIVDARSGRKIHPNTRRADYDRLTADLIARGWTQNDLATFSDPQKLSQTLPDKVCTLVQEWFGTQLALKEPDLQTRLLAESLKPLVGG